MGYSRAVRSGNVIEVSATAASAQDGTILHPGDFYGQTKEALRIISEALNHLGGSVEDVVWTRVFIVDAAKWEEVARAHGEVFGEIRPATGLFAISGFIVPEILVEIEATAIIETS